MLKYIVWSLCIEKHGSEKDCEWVVEGEPSQTRSFVVLKSEVHCSQNYYCSILNRTSTTWLCSHRTMPKYPRHPQNSASNNKIYFGMEALDSGSIIFKGSSACAGVSNEYRIHCKMNRCVFTVIVFPTQNIPCDCFDL